MKIYIEKILNENIYFSTEYGKGKGLWKGANKPKNKQYFVEFDIDKLYNYDDLIIGKKERYQIEVYNEKNYLTLLLLEYDEFGCATFRFGDSIIEIETKYDKHFLLLINLFVTIIVDTLNVYDENI